MALITTLVSPLVGGGAASGAPGDAPITGAIHVDYDQDGEIDPGEESTADYPAGGVTVTAYDSTGASVVCTVTAPAYSCDTTTLGDGPFRVEFTTDPADNYSDTLVGDGYGPAVQVVPAGGSVNYAVVPPSACDMATGGELWTTCFVNGDHLSPAGLLDTVVQLDYDNSGAPVKIAEKSQTGSVWGVAYDQYDDVLYTSAFVKRHVDLGDQGPAGIYWSPDGGATWNSAALGPDFGTALTRDVDVLPTETSYDSQVFGEVGQYGIGDIDLTPSGNTMIVSNLLTNSIYVYDLAANGAPIFRTSHAIADPCGGTGYEVFATHANDEATAYIGVTCTAELSQSNADLAAHVVELDLASGANSSIFSTSLNYPRSCNLSDTAVSTRDTCQLSTPNGDTFQGGEWQYWSDDYNDFATVSYADVTDVVRPQPILSDIEISDDGGFVLGLMDRASHQIGNRNCVPFDGAPCDPQVVDPVPADSTLIKTIQNGDILRVCNVGGALVIEGAAGCATNFASGAADPAASPAIPENNGLYRTGPVAADGEFFDDTTFRADGTAPHGESHSGGLYIQPYSDEVVQSTMNPEFGIIGSGGVQWSSLLDGSQIQGSTLYSYDRLDPQGSLAKAGGIGDVEGCYAPIEIGDYVWFDANNDGIQDPNEPALGGVTVTLSNPDGLVPSVTTTTDANGYYNFGPEEGVLPNFNYVLTFDVLDPAKVITGLPAGVTPADLQESPANAGDDLRDSDMVNGEIIFTSGDVSDHTLDAAYSVPGYDLALIITNLGDPVVLPGDTVPMSITVANQGNISSGDYGITVYIPSGLALDDADWNDNGDGTATYTGADAVDIAPDGTVKLTVDFVATAESMKDFVYAEISSDSGDDEDSTPDATNGLFDESPSATDNSLDDAEDDHDFETITVDPTPVYDLALIVTNLGDAVVTVGDDVNMSVLVENQGNLDSGAYGVTVYIPAGLSLNDADWSDNGDGTATYVGADAAELAPDGTAKLTVDFIADAPGGKEFVAAEISSDSGADADSTADATDGGFAESPEATDNSLIEAEDDHDFETITVEPAPVYDLALIVTNLGDAVVNPGDDVNMSITVANQGDLTSGAYGVTVYIPAGLTLNDADWNDNGDGTATYTGADAIELAPDGTAKLTVDFTAGDAGAKEFVTAEISSDSGDDADSTPDATDGGFAESPEATDNSLTDVEDDHDFETITVDPAPVYDLALILTNLGDPVVLPGDDVPMSITVANQGNLPSGAYDLTVFIPAGLDLNDADWTDNGDGTATYSGADAVDIAPDGTLKLTVDFQATSESMKDFVYAEISNDSGDDADSTPDATNGLFDESPSATDNSLTDVEDDHDFETITVDPAPVYDLGLIITNLGDPVVLPGDDVPMSITVENQGNLNSDEYAVTAYIPAGMILNDADWTDNGDGTATYVGADAVNLAPGETAKLTLDLTAGDEAPKDFVSAEISADSGDDSDSTPDAIDGGFGESPADTDNSLIEAEDDHDFETITVDAAPVYDLALINELAPGQAAEVAPGDTVELSITVANQGDLDSGAYTITSYLPAGFTLADGSDWTDNGDGTVSLDVATSLAGDATAKVLLPLVAGNDLGKLFSWSEISADSGDDADSTPDATNGEVLESPLATDNSLTDPEDDHDPESITVTGTPGLTLEKATNTLDSDTAPGAFIAVGADVEWTYVITNTGDVDLTNVVLTDDIVGVITCPSDTIAAGAELVCSASDVAVADQYTNVATVTTVAPDGTTPSATDPSNYFGADPSVTIVKTTNGDDGLNIAAGTAVEWSYLVTNTGNVALNDVVVTDSMGEVVNCGASTIQPNGTLTCTASGTAIEGAYSNVGLVNATPASGGNVNDEDPSDYFGTAPALSIEKSTNGADSDDAPGLSIPEGTAITWEYVVSNDGNVPLTNVVVSDNQGLTVTCPSDTIAVGATLTCSATGTAAAGDYSNIGSVTATDPAGTPLDASDPSNYFGSTAGLTIEKDTNGVDADGLREGPALAPGDTILWTYVVTNTSNQTVSDIEVTDSDPAVTVTCDATTLAAGESLTCTASGTAITGTVANPYYENIGTVTGVAADGSEPSASDPSHYFSSVPAIDIEKLINGEDADTAGLELVAGDAIVWSYVVTNTGNTDLTNVVVAAGDKDITCPDGSDTLLVGESFTCTGSGVAVEGDNSNPASVTGEDLLGIEVSDEDPTVYTGTAAPAPAIDIEKTINGEQTDDAPGITLTVGDDIADVYVITNTGNVPLTDLNVVVDDAKNITGDIPDSLAPGDSFTLTGTSTAAEGANPGLASVTGVGEGVTVDDSDPTNYVGSVAPVPAIDIEKTINGEQTDDAPGITLTVGDEIVNVYTITNTGDVKLTDIVISDDDQKNLTGDIPASLAPGDSFTLTGVTAAAKGAVAGFASVTADGEGVAVDDTDPTNYVGEHPPEAPTYSVGSQLWLDVNNDGNIDTTETVLAGVTVELYTDKDGDGEPDSAAVATTTTDADGIYFFDGLAASDYIVGIPTSNWAEGGPLVGHLSSTGGEADPDAGVDSNDNGITEGAGAVLSGTFTLGGDTAEPTGEAASKATVTGDSTPDDQADHTVDFGFYEPVFDLALDIAFADGSTELTVAPGDKVLYTITVTNEGNVAAKEITIVDFIPTGEILSDPAWSLNADGNAVLTLTDVLAPGDSVEIPFHTTHGEGSTGAVNTAEIASAIPTDVLGATTLVTPDGTVIPDVDSTPDVVDQDPNDEDDHDTVVLNKVAPTAVPPTPLPVPTTVIPQPTPTPAKIFYPPPPQPTPTAIVVVAQPTAIVVVQPAPVVVVQPTAKAAPAVTQNYGFGKVVAAPTAVVAKAAADTKKGAQLAVTGTESGSLSFFAFGLIAAGLLFLVAGRRRREEF